MRSLTDWAPVLAYNAHCVAQLRARPKQETADATAVIPPGRSDVEDCIQFRLPPGEGEFPVTRMLQTLQGIGGLNRLGPEVFSAVFDRMSADELIEVIRSSQARALDDAGIPQRER